MRYALATDYRTRNLTPDDRLLQAALARQGMASDAVVWDDSEAHWVRFESVIIRSCWDYHLKPARFLEWLCMLERTGVRTMNPPEAIRWNMDKRYLFDLQKGGITIPETLMVAHRNKLHLNELPWDEIVVKPTIGGTAYGTSLLRRPWSKANQTSVNRILESGAILIQKYLPEIVYGGEWSCIFFAGEFSHAVHKNAKSGDFRVQEEFGGTARMAEPPLGLIDAARGCLAAARFETVYARVDIVRRGSDFVLMELELIEPQLFLRLHSPAARNFAAAIIA